MSEKTREQLKRELVFYQHAILKINDVIVELKERVGLTAPEMTVNLQFSGVSSGYGKN
ncbi:MAG: hypothetical protein JRJ77_03895 [Deltaproteobacteria bacterium]|nr:hypothetical protein [Deltaproteobacteria bacterium]